MADLIEVRYPVYAMADITVRTEGGLTHDAMVERIISAVRAFDAGHTLRASADDLEGK